MIDEARAELETALNAGSLDRKDERIIRALKLMDMARSQNRLSSLNCLKDFRSLFRVSSSSAVTNAPKNSAGMSTTDSNNVP